jgi:hypothetical protein
MINYTHMLEEIKRVTSVADYRHERLMRGEANRYVEELKLARAILSQELQGALRENLQLALCNALDALVLMRADADCFDAGKRRAICDHLDDAEDSLRSYLGLLDQDGK